MTWTDASAKWVRTQLIVQSVIVALMLLAAIIGSIVLGNIVLPLLGILGAALTWRDIQWLRSRQERLARPQDDHQGDLNT